MAERRGALASQDGRKMVGEQHCWLHAVACPAQAGRPWETASREREHRRRTMVAGLAMATVRQKGEAWMNQPEKIHVASSPGAQPAARTIAAPISGLAGFLGSTVASSVSLSCFNNVSGSCDDVDSPFSSSASSGESVHGLCPVALDLALDLAQAANCKDVSEGLEPSAGSSGIEAARGAQRCMASCMACLVSSVAATCSTSPQSAVIGAIA